MKKILIILFICALFIPFAQNVTAQENTIDAYFFYGSTCPHCKKEAEFLFTLKDKYDNLKIHPYEVYNNKENAQLLLNLFEEYDQGTVLRVPALFIGEELVIGYYSDQTTGKEIEEIIKYYSENDYYDPLSGIKPETKSQKQNNKIINVPLLGEVNLNSLSLPALTVLVGALDGFNPCAMWVLLFLLALLINVKSRKRIWLIGGTFILVSGVIYYLLLTAWLNLFLAISLVSTVRIMIGTVAIGMGIWQFKNFATYKPGVCKVTDQNDKLQKTLTDKAQEVVRSTALPATLFGIVILAFGVNLVEFFCSAGLPAIYTQILSINQLSSLQYYSYLLLYTVIFMLDDAVVFFIALITMSKLGGGEKYNKWATLVGGILILVLGILLIFRPEWLMFA